MLTDLTCRRFAIRRLRIGHVRSPYCAVRTGILVPSDREVDCSVPFPVVPGFS
jgi:hypothetical protein